MITKIIIINRKIFLNIYETKISNSFIALFVTASSSSSSRYFLSHVGLGSPFTPSLYKRHYMLPMKIYKRNRRKSYVQFAESMGSTALTINLYSIYNSNDQRRFLNTMECDHRGKGQGNFAVFHIFASKSKARFKRRATAVPNSIDRIKFDISTTVARRLKSSRAIVV